MLAAVTLALYLQVTEHQFVTYDDDVYVTGNPQIQTGLNAENVVWAFTSTSAANWHPMTWLSHMLDCQLYGLKSSGHHFTNVLIHLANVLLLFWVLHVMTGALWRSALVAALFALHPLNVESVAWIAERKNLLSTLFWILTLWAYVWYARQPELMRYLAVLALFILGLMSKPMVVTLPFVLLLLDYWPLERLRINAGEPEYNSAPVNRANGQPEKAETVRSEAALSSPDRGWLIIEEAAAAVGGRQQHHHRHSAEERRSSRRRRSISYRRSTDQCRGLLCRLSEADDLAFGTQRALPTSQGSLPQWESVFRPSRFCALRRWWCGKHEPIGGQPLDGCGTSVLWSL